MRGNPKPSGRSKCYTCSAPTQYTGHVVIHWNHGSKVYCDACYATYASIAQHISRHPPMPQNQGKDIS